MLRVGAAAAIEVVEAVEVAGIERAVGDKR
jgi:hypothetical protein